MIGTLPMWLRDTIEAWPLVLGVIGLATWLMRSAKSWMRRNVSDPIANNHREAMGEIGKVDAKVDKLSDRVLTLEVVHNTQDVSAQDITDMLADRRRGGRRATDPK